MRPTHSRKAHTRTSLVVMVAVVFLWQQSVSPSLSQTTNTQPNNVPQLKIVVLAGEDGVNIIKKNTAVKPAVEVRDRNNQPVASAYVTFTAPESGPHVIFAHGSSSYATVTDATGGAMVHIMKPVGQGAFKISIRANFQGRTVTAAIAQTNYLTVAAANAAGAGAAAGAGRAAGGGISGVMIGAIAGAVAVGVGVAVAVSRAGGGAKTPSTPTGTIGAPGTPTIGPP